MESEMDKAKDHHGMVSTEFQKEKHSSRPSSVMSNSSSNKNDVRYFFLDHSEAFENTLQHFRVL